MENITQTNLMCVWERPNFGSAESDRYLIFILKPESFHTEAEYWDLVFGPAPEAECRKFMEENTTSYDMEDHMNHLAQMEEEGRQDEEDWYYDQMLDEMDREAFEP